jgi:hypothetical protein
METENGKPKDMITVNVEMQESKWSRGSQTLACPPPERKKRCILSEFNKSR